MVWLFPCRWAMSPCQVTHDNTNTNTDYSSYPAQLILQPLARVLAGFPLPEEQRHGEHWCCCCALALPSSASAPHHHHLAQGSLTGWTSCLDCTDWKVSWYLHFKVSFFRFISFPVIHSVKTKQLDANTKWNKQEIEREPSDTIFKLDCRFSFFQWKKN